MRPDNREFGAAWPVTFGTGFGSTSFGFFGAAVSVPAAKTAAAATPTTLFHSTFLNMERPSMVTSPLHCGDGHRTGPRMPCGEADVRIEVRSKLTNGDARTPAHGRMRAGCPAGSDFRT